MYSDQLAAQANLPRQPDNSVLEGYVVQGSWDPAEGTIEVLLANTAALFTDYGDAPATVVANLMTNGLGAQYGPVGGERVELFRTPSGYSAQIEHGPDDTPFTPTGEWRTLHRSGAGIYNSGWQLTNDGATVGDGLGGSIFGYLGGLTELRTSSGELLVSLNETTSDVTIKCYGNTIVITADPSITLTTAAGMVTALDDAASVIRHTIPASLVPGGLGKIETTLDAVNNKITHTLEHAEGQMQSVIDGINGEINHIVPTSLKVGIGKAASTLSAANQALAEAHLSTFEGSMFSARLNDLVAFATAMVASGVPNAGTVISNLATLAHIPVPAGSATVLHAP